MPELSQKQDAVPGQHNTIVVTPTRLGTYPVICTELCGLGHALMRSHVDIVSAADFAAFEKNAGKSAGGDPGLAVFQAQGCGSCHTFQPAGSTGKVGPDLDDLAAAAKKANRGTVQAFVQESIVDPGAYLAPGYPDAMPHIFKDNIPPDQLKQLVQYLVKGSKS